MKKLLGIVVLGLLWCNISFAEKKYNDRAIYRFTQWLYDNGHHQYLNLNPDVASYRVTVKNKKDPLTNIHMTHVSKSTAKVNAMEACERAFKTRGKEMQKACYIHSVVELNPCKTEPKYSQVWYQNKCHKFRGTTNLNINAYTERKNEIPYGKNPNRDTLLFYVYYYLIDNEGFGKYLVEPSKTPVEFKSNLKEDKFVKQQLQKKAILSYLYFQDDQIVIDEITPKDRFGIVFKDDTKWASMSMGKSLVSYVAGHAICEGYIDGIDAKINDWPLIENTLYHNQKLIDLLNMSAGDQKHVDSNRGLIKTGRWYNVHPISSFAFDELDNTVKAKSKYNYNGLVTNIIMNYVIHKAGSDFQKLLNQIFQEKAKVKNSVFFFKIKNIPNEFGPGRGSFFASRYDYLRIAKAIMDDYQNDTCVGKYLKEIYKRRIPKKLSQDLLEPHFNRTSSYGGQFHLDYPGLKKRIVFGMGGYGGQAILIDVENSRIVVLNSLHYNYTKYKYNVKKLLIDPIKNGK